jgi:hypothetical protein
LEHAVKNKPDNQQSELALDTSAKIPVCPTCKSQRWAEIYPSNTDPTGLTLYCRHCEEGCVSPLMLL